MHKIDEKSVFSINYVHNSTYSHCLISELIKLHLKRELLSVPLLLNDLKHDVSLRIDGTSNVINYHLVPNLNEHR